eukprot:evm.model.NODE_11280_length_14553_cov_26.447674.5
MKQWRQPRQQQEHQQKQQQQQQRQPLLPCPEARTVDRVSRVVVLSESPLLKPRSILLLVVVVVAPCLQQ